MLRNVTLTLLFIALSFTGLYAQETVFEEVRVAYAKESTYGAFLHTNGWGFNFRKGNYLTGFKRRIYEIEFVTIKSPREIKSLSSNSSNYVYGKLNNLLSLRLSVGNFKTFVAKQSVRGIAISYVMNVGISGAYTKPIYLEVFKTANTSAFERYDPEKHPPIFIKGRAPFLRGIFKGRAYPGLFLRGALNFESARSADRINAIEVGATLDAFLERVPIMANSTNEQFLLNLYFALSFGEKQRK